MRRRLLLLLWLGWVALRCKAGWEGWRCPLPLFAVVLRGSLRIARDSARRPVLLPLLMLPLLLLRLLLLLLLLLQLPLLLRHVRWPILSQLQISRLGCHGIQWHCRPGRILRAGCR